LGAGRLVYFEKYRKRVFIPKTMDTAWVLMGSGPASGQASVGTRFYLHGPAARALPESLGLLAILQKTPMGPGAAFDPPDIYSRKILNQVKFADPQRLLDRSCPTVSPGPRF